MNLIAGNYKAEWVDLGEGRDGDYDPDDPNDVALLRFDTYRRDGDNWEAIDDGSYCTAIPVGTPDPVLLKGLTLIVNELNAAAGRSPKRILEALSWMNPTWFDSPQPEGSTQ